MARPFPPDFEQRLLAHRAPEPEQVPARRAAVAAVLRAGPRSPEVLLMTRVEHPDDPWSGHVSFPGGTAEPEDTDLLATAVRETREEVGLDLERSAALLCRLGTVPAIGRGRVLPMDITAFAFGLREPRPSLELGGEAAEAFWLPLHAALSGELDGTHTYVHGPGRRVLPCWHYQGRTIWGLTYRMLGALLAAVGLDGVG